MNAKLSASVTNLLPGLVLCALVTGTAFSLEHVEVLFFGRAWLESCGGQGYF